MSLIFTGTGPVLVTESPSEYLWTPQGSGQAPVPPLLQAPNIVVLDSVKSGNRVSTKDVYKQLLLPLLDSWNLPHSYVATTSPESVRSVAASVGTTPTLLVLISGDTTITELVNSVASTASVTLLTVPMGTGNAFAHSVGLSTPLAAVQALTTGTARPLRLYEAVFEHGSQLLAQEGAQPVTSLRFLVVGSWGLHACLVADSDSPELRKLGTERFKVAAQRVLEQNPVFHGSKCAPRGVFPPPGPGRRDGDHGPGVRRGQARPGPARRLPQDAHGRAGTPRAGRASAPHLCRRPDRPAGRIQGALPPRRIYEPAIRIAR
ncbi:hypothetical protein KL928_003174 [Ogataea angusta]|uniref:DAGKc domain-containing protein n=1 Tax=Pichia angusta TaxID=870730 RepID=A0AAN6DEN8_PICAN|nr:uncharacterized protein KL928_003174 [Ogataea angusta]KAG7818173.1 hypothetical protein KL928_003174 [Ogataea angusta]